MGFLTMILPALFPVIADVVKVGFSKITGVSMGEPRDFTEHLEWEKLQIEKLKVLAQLDKPGANISRWVADFRAVFRYFAVTFILAIYGVTLFLPPIYMAKEARETIATLAGSAMFYIIGDRVYLGLKRNK